MQSNISYLESLQYFNNLKEYVDEHAELVFNYESQNEKHTGENKAQRTVFNYIFFIYLYK